MKNNKREPEHQPPAMIAPPDLKIEVSADGQLRLSSSTTGADVELAGEQAAMWIAFRQHEGRINEAADMLAEFWDRDPETVRCSFWSWAHQMWCIGTILMPRSALAE